MVPAGEDLPLPPRLATGLVRWLERNTGWSPPEARAFLERAWGPEPSLGQLRRSEEAHLSAASRVPAPAGWTSTLRWGLAELRLDTPTCDACGAFPWSADAGRLESLVVLGAVCPLCRRGTLVSEPVEVRRLAWTSGALVSSAALFDRRTLPGVELPLTDAGLLAWAGAFADPALLAALREADLPLTAWVGWARWGARALPDPLEVAALLSRPEALLGRPLAQTVRRAAAWWSRTEAARWVGRAPARPRGELRLEGRSWSLIRRIGRGDSSVVYLARSEGRRAERVVAKVGFADFEALAREVDVLRGLARSSAKGAPHFTRVLPEVVAAGGSASAHQAVFRLPPGFQVSGTQARAAAPGGLPAPVVVWVYKRMLELLQFFQEAGLQHGAITPDHLLLHPREHGATLIGFSQAGALGGPLGAFPARWAGWLPPGALGQPAPPGLDRVMAARTAAWLAGADLPPEITEVLQDQASDASLARREAPWNVRTWLDQAAARAFGPPRYHPLWPAEAGRGA